MGPAKSSGMCRLVATRMARFCLRFLSLAEVGGGLRLALRGTAVSPAFRSASSKPPAAAGSCVPLIAQHQEAYKYQFGTATCWTMSA